MHFLGSIRAERKNKPRVPQNDSCSEPHHNLLLLSSLLLFHIDRQSIIVGLNPVTHVHSLSGKS